MTLRPLAYLCLLFMFAGPAQAAEIQLASKIPAGNWTLAYQRTASLKLLLLKRKEQGTSQVCMSSDPRKQILGWLTDKGCTVDRESLQGEVYKLHGMCTLKWWQDHPIPVSVELRPENKTAFSMLITTDPGAFIGFEERTQASFQGACEESHDGARKKPVNTARQSE